MTNDREELDAPDGSAVVFFDHSEHGCGPVRVHLDESERQWLVIDSMNDCVAACGYDENAARLICDLLNRELSGLVPPNNKERGAVNE